MLIAFRTLSALVTSCFLGTLACEQTPCGPGYVEGEADLRVRRAEYRVRVGDEGLILIDGTDRSSETQQDLLGVSANWTTPMRSYHWAAVGRGGVIRISSDQGDTWSVSNVPVNDELYAVAFSCEDPELGFAVGEHGVILRTQSGGADWTSIASGVELGLYDVAITASGVILIVGQDGVILRSEDLGEGWTNVTTKVSSDILSISAAAGCREILEYSDNRRLAAVGTEGTLLFTEDDGKSWAVIDVGANADLRQVEATADPYEIEQDRFATILEGSRLWRWGIGQESLTLIEDFSHPLDTLIRSALPNQGGVIGSGREWLYVAPNCL